MKCPFCSHAESKVTDSRTSAAFDVTRRRRECERCQRRFTTYERVEETLPLVVKKDGRREPFERHKLLGGLRKACEKRPIAMNTLETMVDEIERELIESGEKEVPGSVVGQTVMRRLRTIDGIAYVRFASVYREFRDLDELRCELDRIANEVPSQRVAAQGVLADQGVAKPSVTANRADGESVAPTSSAPASSPSASPSARGLS